jgi:hypothetical protein
MVAKKRKTKKNFEKMYKFIAVFLFTMYADIFFVLFNNLFHNCRPLTLFPTLNLVLLLIAMIYFFVGTVIWAKGLFFHRTKKKKK